ncbi:hypothetical protein [Halovivax cerinus]|uniref:Uncharacterized protein n=1 Tax=Halovivax cerinus TaxID=1487865 RepID=A0ABD5NMU2_9EURY|nr:hypothetical protein [Halovivax cerinus]
MSNVFLARCESPTFDETVASSVDLADYPDHPDGLADGGAVRFWGVSAGSRNESNFEKLAEADLVLFYQDGAYVATGRVERTLADEAEWASDAFDADDAFTMLYTLSDVAKIRVPREKVNRLFEYSSSYEPHGLLRVNPSNVDASLGAIELALERVSE